MNTLFYANVDGIIRQVKVLSHTIHSYGNVVGHYRIEIPRKKTWSCSCNLKLKIAGLGGVFYQGNVRSFYRTIDDCRNERNRMDACGVINDLLRQFYEEDFELSEHITPYNTSCEVSYNDDHQTYVVESCYYVWDGVKAVRYNPRNYDYDIVSKVLTDGLFNTLYVRKEGDKIYATEEECLKDNVVEVVLFSNEEC